MGAQKGLNYGGDAVGVGKGCGFAVLVEAIGGVVSDVVGPVGYCEGDERGCDVAGWRVDVV